MAKLGCIPAFMAPFVNESWAVATFQSCNQTQYAEINEMGVGFIQAHELYTPPCTESNSIVTATDGTELIRMMEWKESLMEGKFIFQLHYSSDMYRETVSVMAFDFATLWSQIGGFIGMFLGYSLLQVPELAQKCIIRINTLLRNV